MNQHASRPAAQGFPLHRRMNGPSIPPVGPRTRPSNPSFLRSQIPIRVERSVPQHAFLRAQALRVEQHRHLFTTSPSFAVAALHPMRTSVGQQPIEIAFNVYEDRLQTDLRDFRAMCCRLVLKEREEKERWHNLCMKMMKERDTARQRVSALISERETHFSSASSSSTTIASDKEKRTSKASKRARDGSSSAEESPQELPSTLSSPIESRPIRSLRSSPIPSPPGNPSASLYNSSTAINSSSLPSPTFPPPPSLNTTVSPTSATPCSPPVPPLDIITFNPTRSPNDKTCFDVYGVIDIPETRPVKRRKSYDLSDKQTQITEDKDSGGRSRNDVEAEAESPRPFLIAYTDIMYIPMKGHLSCRACLLDKTTNPSSSRIPKTFPTNVCWDELRDHCVNEHPKACADVARLCPADLNELRKRLYGNV